MHRHSLPMVSCICKCQLGIAGLYMDYILRRDIEIYDHISRSCTWTIQCAAILKYTIIYRAVARLDSSINLFYLFISVLTFTFSLLFFILLIFLIELLFNFHCHFYSSPNTVEFSIFFTAAALLSSCLF